MPKIQECRNGCGIEIVVKMDDDLGKWRPFEYNEYDDDFTQPHNCPKSSYNQNKGSFGQQKTTQFKPKPQPQQPREQYTRSADTPKDIPKTTVGGAALDTKRLLVTVQELVSEVKEMRQEQRALREELERNTNIDTNKLIGTIQQWNDVIAPFMKTQFHVASELEQDRQKESALVNHSQRAEQFQEMKANRRNPTQTKFYDESNEQTLDERIPDSDDGYDVVDESSDDSQGVVTEDL